MLFLFEAVILKVLILDREQVELQPVYAMREHYPCESFMFPPPASCFFSLSLGREGDCPDDGLYFITKGRVEVLVDSAGGGSGLTRFVGLAVLIFVWGNVLKEKPAE